jgi:hypothetical protein
MVPDCLADVRVQQLYIIEGGTSEWASEPGSVGGLAVRRDYMVAKHLAIIGRKSTQVAHVEAMFLVNSEEMFAHRFRVLEKRLHVSQ